MRLVSLQMRGGVARDYIFSLIWRCYGPKLDIVNYWGQTQFVYYPIISYRKIKVYRVEKIDMGRSHWNNCVSGKIPLEQWCQWNYGTYCTRYDAMVSFLL